LRKYEMMIVYNVDESTADEVNATVKDAFTANNVTALNEKDMGVKNLAYEIESKTRGHYYLYQIETEQTNLDGLKRNFKLNSKVLRYLITKQDK
jgi:small subunit ribosomal protein S6